MSSKCAWTSGTSCGALQQALSRRLISSTASSWLDSPGKRLFIKNFQPHIISNHCQRNRCIFELDPEDVAALRLAKQGELLARGVGPVSEKALDQMISRKELALHCRKRTRGVEETARRIKALIDEMDSEKGRDTLGVPLLDHERIQQIWKDQQRHTVFRIQRASLWTSARDAHFQAYLLERLMRWNQDRMEESVRGNSELRTYSSAEREAMDRLSRKILRMPLDERYQPPGVYTGKNH
ncbi:hypothetical protein XENOCAPTIV_016174 [Xenoophorus captivus]|uniref:Uncharacterized protein n=1 Tax=Xenoophorus captivus TaxID=1517983 RepID=A0ABV0RHK6_9TELE